MENCREGRTWKKFIVNDGFVFRANKLCIPASFVRLLLLQEAHGGGLMGHFGVDGRRTCYTFLLAKDETGC